jgi:asparagine synthase (glutamine-hydrolysing)
MADVIAHRGPDDSGYYCDDVNGLGFGFRRLSIIDLSSAGHQPMSNEDGTIWIVFNGEIYNFTDLRAQLEQCGHVFKSHTDTETVIHGYEEWGAQVIERMRGMFGFALWDQKGKSLLLARDRIGIKPLFYYHDAQQIVFGSELKAVLAAPGVPREVNRRGIYDYLTYNYIPSPHTAYLNILKLPPGHWLLIDKAGLHLTQYWDVNPMITTNIDEGEAVLQVRHGLEDAVRSHLIADVPVGVFLSGGVDSSTLAILMADMHPDPVHTFSVGFDVNESSELPYARSIVEQIHANAAERVLTWPNAQSQLQQVIDIYDEPFADSSSVPVIAVSQMAREQVKVALSGEGGDEVFAGYSSYEIWTQQQRFGAIIPNGLKTLLSSLARFWPLSRGWRYLQYLTELPFTPLEQYGRMMEWISLEEKRRLVPPEMQRDFGEYDDRWYFRQYWREETDLVTRLQYLDLKTYLADDLLVKADRASMSVSLEVRVPLLDHPLVESLFRVPGSLRFKNRRTKYLQRTAMADRLPQAILKRRKMGFAPPLNRWLTKGKSQWAHDLLDNGAAVKMGLLQPNPIDLLSSKPEWLWASKVWVLLILETWARKELIA